MLFPYDEEQGKDVYLSSLLLNIFLEVMLRAIKQETEIKGI